VDLAYRLSPLAALALGAVLAIAGVITAAGELVIPGVILVLAGLGASRMKRFHAKAPGWEIGGESITPQDIAQAAGELARLRGQQLSPEQAEQAARDMLPAPVTVTPAERMRRLDAADREAVARARQSLIGALAEHIVAEAGHYAYCPRCGFHHPLEKGEVVPSNRPCPACGTQMETTDSPQRGMPSDY